MALTNSQLLDRITTIEEKLNEIQVALNNVPTKVQMKALLNIRQAEIQDLQTRMTSLENRVTILEDS